MVTRRVLGVGMCLMMLAAPAAFAADAPSVGVVAGVNSGSASLSGLDATGISSSYSAGLYAGGFVVWPISSRIGVEADIAYAQKPFTLKDGLSGFTSKEKWDWIEVPILARVGLWRSGTHSLYALGGPGFSVRARAKEDAGGQTADVKDSVRSTDVSLIGGVGMAFGKLAVEARYDGGLRDLNQDNKLGDLLTVKSRAITVAVKWTLR